MVMFYPCKSDSDSNTTNDILRKEKKMKEYEILKKLTKIYKQVDNMFLTMIIIGIFQLLLLIVVLCEL